MAVALAVLPCAAGAADAVPPGLALPAQFQGVTVKEQKGALVFLIRMAGPARYRAEFLDAPYRLVVDLEDTVYAWPKTAVAIAREPVKQIRGGQYRDGVARVVLDFTRKVGYAILEDARGLAIIVPADPAVVAGDGATPLADSSTLARRVTKAAAVAEPPPGANGFKAPPTAAGEGAPTAEASKPAVETPNVPAAEPTRPAPAATLPRPSRLAQATTPAPAAGQRLISLEFKDADVVNLLRILAAESGRNIVIGDDVKGKMSISLRNVPWELALDTILDTRNLERVEKDGVMRIVSREALTKERESKAKVEEARIKGEAEARTKLAEAQVKEAEAQSKKLAADAARQEQEARGPLREETLRLSYADPEEVAKTLQGILGIPAEGKKVEGPGYVIAGPVGAGPIAEPPFSQLFGPGAVPPPPGPVSVSQDVLAKGLTIRAHKPTNTLFLRLYQADLERVKKIIRESLDIPLPQVKIEARMEVLDRSALEQIGIQWGGAGVVKTDSQTIVGRGLETAAGAALIPGGIATQVGPLPNPALTLANVLPISATTGLPLGGNLINLPISALPNAGASPAGNISFGIVGTNFNINLALQALATQGKTRTLARPEVVTVENARAIMSLGEEIPYATISSAGTQIQFKEALLKLEVTPTVIQEQDVTKVKLIVIVENNSRGDVVNLGTAGSPPAINKRKAETQVLVKEGERLVIGGVTTSVHQHTVRKVPIFGDIPLLGWLFKQRENFESGRELVVFLTPIVLGTRDRAAAAAAPPGK